MNNIQWNMQTVATYNYMDESYNGNKRNKSQMYTI